MPVPGVPTLAPVDQPNINLQRAGQPGAAISDFGESLAGDADMEYRVRAAQAHVDTLAARNQLDATYTATQDQLAKTQNSRDVPDVIAQSIKTLNQISSEWSKSPAAVQIQQDADALRPPLAHLGNMHQIQLMGNEFKINLDQQSDKMAEAYAGGDRTVAEQSFGDAVMGGVRTGLIGTADASEYMRQFRIKGQELELKNGISNADPTVNQQTYDKIVADRAQFPDLTQEKLDTLKGQALEAFESHTRMKEWAEGQMALKTLPAKINEFTNPANGRFDEGAAMKDNADRFAKGEITDTQSKVLAEGFQSHQAQLEVGIKQEAAKKINAVDDLLSKHQFTAARKQMADDENWFTTSGLEADHMNELRYMNQMEAQVRAEAAAARGEAAGARSEKRAEYLFDREAEQIQSGQIRGKLELELAAGKVYEPQDIRSIEGLSDHDRSELLQAVNPQNENPYVKDGLNKISELGILDSSKYELARVFVNQVKADDRRGSTVTDLADKLIKEAKSQHSQAWIDQLYRQTTEGRRPDDAVDSIMSTIRNRNTPAGATMQVPDKKTGLMHWSDGKRDLGVVK